MSKTLTSFAKRRGFVYPSSEIYGGFSSTYDYGPQGAQLLKNVRDIWWKKFVEERRDVVGLDGAIFCHPKTWEASGHVQAFNDPLVEDKVTHQRYRADHLLEEALNIDMSKHSFAEMQELLDKNQIKSPAGNQITKIKSFNLLVEAGLGSTDESKSKAYLRGETCQTIFLQYLNIIKTQGVSIPFGIAQMGKAFRNEITTKDFIYRTREFEQLEMEFFIHPNQGDKWYEYWREFMLNWAVNELGLPRERFRFRAIPDKERSHYAKRQEDFEFQSSTGKWFELSPMNHRGDWDLSRHQQYSGQNLEYTDAQTGEKFIPNVIEISLGLNRLIYAILDNGYHEQNKRAILKISPKIAPVQVAVFPLLKNKSQLVELAEQVFAQLVKAGFRVAWDQRGNIGKRYLSQDEIGTPICLTVDFQSAEDQTVTWRDRDTTVQKRLAIAELVPFLQKMLE